MQDEQLEENLVFELYPPEYDLPDLCGGTELQRIAGVNLKAEERGLSEAG